MKEFYQTFVSVFLAVSLLISCPASVFAEYDESVPDWETEEVYQEEEGFSDDVYESDDAVYEEAESYEDAGYEEAEPYDGAVYEEAETDTGSFDEYESDDAVYEETEPEDGDSISTDSSESPEDLTVYDDEQTDEEADADSAETEDEASDDLLLSENLPEEAAENGAESFTESAAESVADEALEEAAAGEVPDLRTVFPESITLYFMSAGNDVIGQPEEYPFSCQLPVSVAEQKVSYRVSSGNYVTTVTDGAVVQPKGTVWYWSGGVGSTVPTEGATVETRYESGSDVITASVGGETVDISVTVEDYSWIWLDQKLDSIVSEYLTDNMSDYEKLIAITKYTAEEYDYDAGHSGAMGMLMYGGGDCWASTDLIIRLCKKVGINAWIRNGNRDGGAGSGHKNAIACIDGHYYVCEAGYAQSKPRAYDVTEEPEGYTVDSTGAIIQYDGTETDLYVPSSINGKDVTNIGTPSSGAVFFYADITSIHIPASVTYIAENAFAGNDELTDIIVDPENSAYCDIDGALYSKDGKTLVCYPDGRSDIEIQEGTEEIGKAAFWYSYKSKVIRIPESVVSIGEYAFGRTYRVSDVIIPDQVTSIADNAFANSKFRIFCRKGSYAEQYAIDHQVPYIIQGELNDGQTEITGIEDQIYSGREVALPDLKMTRNGTALYKNRDYQVSYSGDRIHAGHVTVTITGKGSCLTGEIVKTFAILPRPLEKSMIISRDLKCTYTGQELKPLPTLYYAGRRLENGTDYSLLYSDHINAGEGTITITGQGDFNGTISMPFIIQPASLSGYIYVNLDMESAKSAVYTGEPIEIPVNIRSWIKDLVVTEGIDYTVRYENNTEPGTASVVIEGKGNYKGSVERTFEIRKAHPVLAFSETTLYAENLEGETVSNQLSTSVDSLDVTYTSSNPDMAEVDPESGVVTIRQDGVCTITAASLESDHYAAATASYDLVVKGQLDDGLTVVSGPDDQVYTGSETVISGLKVKRRNRELIQGTDYSVSLEGDSINVGTVDVIIKGLGDRFGGSIRKSMKILPKPLTEKIVPALGGNYIYSGDYPEPDLFDYDTGKWLEHKKDYTISYSGKTDVGKVTATVTGTGNYTGRRETVLTIIPQNIVQAISYWMYSSSVYYTGLPHENVYRFIFKTEMEEGRDYRLIYTNCINVGTASVTLKGIGNYDGELTRTFEILPESLSYAEISGIPAKTYTGSQIKPVPKVTLDGRELAAGKDFKVTYKNNVNAGTAELVLTGTGNYTGTAETSFTIKPASLKNADISGIVHKIYNGKPHTQTPVVKLNDKTLKPDRDYYLAYKNNVNTGRATIAIKGKGNYTGVAVRYFAVKPKASWIDSITSPGKKKITVRWGRRTQISGYQIEFSTRADFGSPRTQKNVYDPEKLSMTVSLAKAKTLYYVRIRTFKKTKDKTYFSTWSKTKKIVTK